MMGIPLPKYWIYGGTRFVLKCLASEAKTNAPLYIMEDFETGMNTAIPFDDPDLKCDPNLNGDTSA
jgi:hypothetical protein